MQVFVIRWERCGPGYQVSIKEVRRTKKYAIPPYYGEEHIGCWCEKTGNSILENE